MSASAVLPDNDENEERPPSSVRLPAMTRPGPELIPAHRRALILEHIQKRGAASIQELADAVHASPSTVRRDLEHLEERGYLERAHGGALLQQRQPRSTFEPESAISAQLARPEKRAIGLAAAAMLGGGESVIFDSSSTVAMAARACLDRDLALTAVTNDLAIGQMLAMSVKMRVVVPGGTVRPGSMTMTGMPGEAFITRLHADIAFIGVHAISKSTPTETSLEVAAMKAAMISAARRVILLADGSKFRIATFCDVCDPSKMHEVVTDDQAPKAEIAELRRNGIVVTVVSPLPAKPLAALNPPTGPQIQEVLR
jgi:DeoR family transcriptional regulator of aga operon